jgi:hypothetical protein
MIWVVEPIQVQQLKQILWYICTFVILHIFRLNKNEKCTPGGYTIDQNISAANDVNIEHNSLVSITAVNWPFILHTGFS